MYLLGAAKPDQFVKLDVPWWAWTALFGVVAATLLLDLMLVHRRPHVISLREASIESAAWIALGVAFAGAIWVWGGGSASGEYIAGYLIEKSLSIDNVFVWAVIFSYFAVPPQYQFRVLFWGIFGALVLRLAFILAGVALLEAFDWILYVFGVLLLVTAVKIARHSGTEVHPERNLIFRLVRKVVPSTSEYDSQHLFTKRAGRLLATPLFAVLVLIETTDIVFAVDSIPAILAVSREPFIVFSSNVFAILGLRALYFLLAGMAGKFRYLHVGLGVILGFVGVKMLIADFYHMPSRISVPVILAILAVTILASLYADRRDAGKASEFESPHPDDPHRSSDPAVSDPSRVPEEALEPYLDIDLDEREDGKGEGSEDDA